MLIIATCTEFALSLSMKFTDFIVILFFYSMNKPALISKLAMTLNKEWTKSFRLFHSYALVILHYYCMRKFTIVSKLTVTF